MALHAIAAGGAEQPFLSRDVNAQETKRIFNSLLRLSSALNDVDLSQIERAVGMLDDDFERWLRAVSPFVARIR